MLGRLLTSFGQDGTVTKVTRGSMVRELHVCSNICLTIFVPLTVIDKTDPSDPLKREDYWRSTLKTMAPLGLNTEESVWQCYYQYVEYLYFYATGTS